MDMVKLAYSLLFCLVENIEPEDFGQVLLLSLCHNKKTMTEKSVSQKIYADFCNDVTPVHVQGIKYVVDGDILMPISNNAYENTPSLFEQPLLEYISHITEPITERCVAFAYIVNRARNGGEYNTFVQQVGGNGIIASQWRFHPDFHAIVHSLGVLSTYRVVNIPHTWLKARAIQLRRTDNGNEELMICPDRIAFADKYLSLKKGGMEIQIRREGQRRGFLDMLKILRKISRIDCQQALYYLRYALEHPDLEIVAQKLEAFDSGDAALDILVELMDDQQQFETIMKSSEGLDLFDEDVRQVKI